MKVLVAIDDSDCSSSAVDTVVSHQWKDDTEFRVITVNEPLYNEYLLAGFCVPSFDEMQSEYHSKMARIVEEKTQQIRVGVPHCRVTGCVINGAIAETILSDAESWDADLIVLGSHGRNGLEKLWLGSVAERVVSHAPCSVEVVKAKKCTSRESKAPKTLGPTVQSNFIPAHPLG